MCYFHLSQILNFIQFTFEQLPDMEQKKSSTDEGQLQGGLLLDTGENKRGDGAEGEGGGGGEQTSNQSPAADGAEIVPQT